MRSDGSLAALHLYSVYTRIMSESAPDALPELMSVACARFFASDWELASLLEFLGDLRLRAAEALAQALDVVSRRLSDHLTLVLQIVVVRSTDNYFAYLRDVRQSIDLARAGSQHHLSLVFDAGELRLGSNPESRAGLDVDSFAGALRVSSAIKLSNAFSEHTGFGLFESRDEADTLSRLLAVRNVVSHNRTLASRAFSELVDDAPSSDLGVDWKRVRSDLLFLRTSVRRIDYQAWVEWKIDRPVTRAAFVDACQHATRGEPLRPAEGRDLLDDGFTVVPDASVQ